MMRGDAEGFVTSLRRLRAAQKSSKGAPLYSLVVNRPLGRIFAAAAHQFGLTPNAVTGISAVFTFAGIGTIALGRPSWPLGIVVSVLLAVGYALDSSDGQLARLRGGGSLLGEWLDHVIDSIKIATLHLAVLVMAYRFFPGARLWLLVPLVFSAAYVVHFFGMLLTELLARVHGLGKRTGEFSLVNALFKLPTDYGVLCVVFILLGVPAVFMLAYSLMALCTVVYTGLVLIKWSKQVRGFDAAQHATAADEAVHV